MRTELLLGDEAAGRAAIDAGIGGVFSYPGTPATEVFEYVQEHAGRPGEPGAISAAWSANEKVAYEEALGMSYAGRRALVAMKHVGLNVAADPLMSSALTGINAGMVLIVADDPGMHSSQNEQDSRYYHEFSHLPMMEPGTQQDAYDQVLEAFEYSEAVGLPVMVRMVTRLCHSRADVRLRDQVADQESPASVKTVTRPDAGDWVLVPGNARRRYRHLLGLQPRLLHDSERSPFNTLRLAGRRGILSAGIAHNYVAEALGGRTTESMLHVRRYPLPVSLVREFVDHCDDILIAEDGYPFIEQHLGGLLGLSGKTIRGRLSGDLPRDGELTPDSVAAAMGLPFTSPALPMEGLPARPPQLCKGCPHTDSFRAILEACAPLGDTAMFGDIGCYALGAMPPLRAVHTCVDMGASIGMALGAVKAGMHPVICTIGDSTFAHSGMAPLLGAVHANAGMTVFILDNAAIGMTGAQESMSCGDRLIDIVRGLGVDPAHLHVIEPLPKRHEANVALIRRELEYRGLSVIVPRRACIHVKRQARDKEPSPACGPACSCTPVTISSRAGD